MKTIVLLLSLFGFCLANAQTLEFRNIDDISIGRIALNSVIIDDEIYICNGYIDASGKANNYKKDSIKNNLCTKITKDCGQL